MNTIGCVYGVLRNLIVCSACHRPEGDMVKVGDDRVNEICQDCGKTLLASVLEFQETKPGTRIRGLSPLHRWGVKIVRPCVYVATAGADGLLFWRCKEIQKKDRFVLEDKEALKAYKCEKVEVYSTGALIQAIGIHGVLCP